MAWFEFEQWLAKLTSFETVPSLAFMPLASQDYTAKKEEKKAKKGREKENKVFFAENRRREL